MSDSENGGNLYKPYRFSGKNHSFDPQVEKPILKQIRAWSNDYMKNNSIVHKSSYISL